MAGERQTPWVLIGIVVVALIGIFFAAQQGGFGRPPLEEKPYWYSGNECCTCARTLATGLGDVRPGMTETLFKNVKAANCVELCNYVHQRTKVAGWQYSVNAFISNDAACEVLKPVPQSYSPQPTAPAQRVGAGAYRSSPAQGLYE